MAINVSPDFIVTPLPHVIRIETSSLCNLRCIYCPTGARTHSKRGVMTDAVFQKILQELKANKNVDVAVLYHGGEPFLNKNILEMVRVLKSEKVRFVKTVTNGMLIKEDMLGSIIKSRLDSIEFSLDGNSPEENDYIRVGSDYRRVVSIIKKLLALKDKLKSRTPKVFIANMHIPTESVLKERKKAVTPPHLKKEFAEFKGKIGFINYYTIKWPGLVHSRQYTLVQAINSRKQLNYCNHVVETTTVRWNGDVVPCCYDISGQYVIGNIMRQPLKDIWNNDKYRQLRCSIRNRDFIELCSSCRVVKPQTYLAKKDDN